MSESAVRNRKSRSSAAVSIGELAEKVTPGMPAGPSTRSATGKAFLLELGPTMAWTPSTSIRRRAAATALSGSDIVSPMANSTGRPSTPPPWLTCLSANSKARCLSRATCSFPAL